MGIVVEISTLNAYGFTTRLETQSLLIQQRITEGVRGGLRWLLPHLAGELLV